MKHFQKLKKIMSIPGSLYRLLNRGQKISFCILLILTIGFSIIETVGISAIMPFISLASNPDLLASGLYKKAFDFTGFTGFEPFIITFGIVIIFFYIFRAVYSVLLTYFINRFSLDTHKYLSKKMFKTILSISYKTFVQKNSAEQIRAISEETNDVGKIILNLMKLLSEAFTVLMIYAVIIIINWKMTLVITFVLLLMTLFILFFSTKKNRQLGAKRLETGRKIYRSLIESLGNIKFIKLKGNEAGIIQNYETNTAIKARTEVINNVLGDLPKGILESIGFSMLIAAVIFFIWMYHDASGAIPIITMYALALYRILPSIHRMLQQIGTIAYLQKTLESVNENLNQPVENEGSAPVEFERSVRLENINFKYMTGNEVITGVSFTVNKGEKIAITGESGGGKSTLVDIIIGIHKPISGEIYIDDTLLTDGNIRSWRMKIGYIPQSIYLFDGTVAENISFGSEPDKDKITKALQRANIWDFLAQKEGIHTRVGDGGIQLSGGQQQRIGIARALYDDPEVLVLDEATSALDTETEKKIMDEIYSVSENKTLIVIAHRLSTVERCDRKIRIEHGKIIK
ncbi:MAG: ATP-binding cassette domain-containing protein [Treponema sp.]|jgi:ATP-binding cassette subfamily B protein/ATP-binding cassette subfamily C protein|nr:ATP-binding cassette domain-containing protein [Treponema sp.]